MKTPEANLKPLQFTWTLFLSLRHVRHLKIFFSTVQHNDVPDNVDDAIALINTKIGQFDQRILKQEYGLTNEEFYIFHSTAKTSMSKLQNTYSEDELDFFKLIISKVLQNEELTISPIEALNLSSGTTGKINKLRAQKLLDDWIACHLFYKHKDNNIYLGAKILTEFKELLQAMELEYLKSCSLCENIALWGEHCESCHTVFHQSCIKKFLSSGTGKCPSCKEKWPIAN